MIKKYSHFIIAPTEWSDMGLTFRRHRLTNKLLSMTNTEKVYWIYPQNITSNFLNKKVKQGLVEIGVPVKKGSAFWSNDNKLSNLIKEIAKEDIRYLWYTYPAFPNLRKIGWVKKIYDCSDNWDHSWGSIEFLGKIKSTLRSMIIKRSELDIIRSANHIFVTSRYLKAKVGKTSKNGDIFYLSNGVDSEFFNSKVGKEFDDLNGPKIGYIGAFKKKIDIDLLKNLADENKNWKIILMGPVVDDVKEEVEDLSSKNNVYYYEPVDITEVPRIMSQLHIGLLPYRNIEYNKAVSPLKLYEYLAVGVPVVGMGVPETSMINQTGIYYFSNNRKEFLENARDALKIYDDKNYIKKRIELAKENDWDVIIKKIIDRVLV